jgi:MarR family transcriptional regulator, organic hydroperoxide resistance regulator
VGTQIGNPMFRHPVRRSATRSYRANPGYRAGVHRGLTSENAAELRRAELDVRTALGDLDLDLGPLMAVSNIFRAATAVRSHMETTVLAAEQLSWSAFVVLFVLRVWGLQESRQLATEAGITPGTLTGVLKTLEKRGLARRETHPTDRRRVIVAATDAGLRAIDTIMPNFNREEAVVTGDLTTVERADLSHLLRLVLRSVDAAGHVSSA